MRMLAIGRCAVVIRCNEHKVFRLRVLEYDIRQIGCIAIY